MYHTQYLSRAARALALSLAAAGAFALCSLVPVSAQASAARLAGAMPEPPDDAVIEAKDKDRGGRRVDLKIGGGDRARSFGGGNRGRSFGGGDRGRRSIGGGNRGRSIERSLGRDRGGNGKTNGRGHLGGHNWGDSPIGGEFFGGRSFDGGIGGRSFDSGNPRGSTGYDTAPTATSNRDSQPRGGGRTSTPNSSRTSTANSGATAASNDGGSSVGSGGGSVSFGGPTWTSGAKAVANARPGASRAVILTAVAGSAAEAASTAASAANGISSWPWANPEVAEPTYAAAQAALTAGKHAQAALLTAAPQAVKLHMANAQTSAKEARAAAQQAVQAWQRSPGIFSGRSRDAAEAAVRAAEAAAIEIQVARRALSIAENKALAQKSDTGRVIAASAVIPTQKPKPGAANRGAAPRASRDAGVVSAALTAPGAPSDTYTRVMERAESSAVTAAKANADAQVAAISAFATMDSGEATRFAEAARAAANDAKGAAAAAAQAHTEARTLAQKDIDSVAAQAQAEVAGRAAEKARLHAQSAESAAERANGVIAVKPAAAPQPPPRLLPTRASAAATGRR